MLCIFVFGTSTYFNTVASKEMDFIPLLHLHFILGETRPNETGSHGGRLGFCVV
jgi:hypothetical protein